MSTLSDLVVDTCLTEISSIETSTDSDSVLSFYIEPMNIKPVLVLFISRVGLFQISHNKPERIDAIRLNLK